MDTSPADPSLDQAVLTALPVPLAVLDREGTIVRVSDAWAALDAAGDVALARGTPGASYLEVCRVAGAAPAGPAAPALAMVRAALAGHGGGDGLEHRSTAAEARWYEMRVVALGRPAGGALVTHLDVTRRKHAEGEARRHLGDIAHLTRVAVVGELASSFVHELNQPLAAILANAQAARRFLASGRADPAEILEILDDIAADDRRAGEVIGRVRNLLRKAAPRLEAIDLNAVVEDVARLLARDAVLRGATIACALAPGLPPTVGDEIQLRQVVLNLVVNALEAVSERPPGARRVTIDTRSEPEGGVELAVHDTGEGIRARDLDRVFEPFFTTKAEGLGMGLAISRAIVKAHGGRLRVESPPGGGTTFLCALPAKGSGA